ncbi:unnamed protein product, partial [Pocillopora meandrina]
FNKSSDSSTAVTPEAPKISSRTEKLAKDFVSTLNKVDVQQNSSLKEAVNLFQDTIEEYRRIHNLETQVNLKKREERVKSISETAKAFEDFVLKYAQHHLSESMPQIYRVYESLVLLHQRASHGNNQDFYLVEPQKVEYIRIPSRIVGRNGSLLVGIIYTDLHSLFKPTRIDNNTSLNSKLIAATMDPMPKQLEQNVIMRFRNIKATDTKRQCVFWNEFNEESPDGWSGEGCHVVTSESDSEETECSCNHLTHFAVLLEYDGTQTITGTHQKTLNILTYMGLALSLIGITITVFSYIFLSDMHQPLSQIRVSLTGSLGAGQVIFLAGINKSTITATCVAVAALMQYFFTAAFCWMMVEGIYLYLFIVKVYNIKNRMAIYHAFSWVFPAVMVIFSLSIAAGKDGIKSFVDDEHCWMSSANNLIWIFVAFVIIVEVLNILILVRVIREMTKMQQKRGTIQHVRLGIRTCVILLPLLGFTWLFGLLSPVHRAFTYIFIILNSTQGFLIFLLHCVRNSQVRFSKK